MIGGVHGKILHVDLTNGETRVEQPPSELFELLVGGRALTAYLLLRDLPPNCDPLGPENRLIFAPGIMQGTNFPGAGRHGVGGKSPLTGALASSEAGGWWGHEFKRTGYDALVIYGKAEKPVYLWIHNDKVEIRDAAHLWGQKTAPVQAAIHEELDNHKVRVAQIGPAGENLVKYAAVMHDINRAAGRNGVGALMGSKNLKAIAVRGTTKVPVGKRKQVTGVAKWLGDNYKTKAAWATAGIGRGTQDGLVGLSYVGGLPTNNFGEPVFEDPELLGGERNYEMFLKERDTCQSCPITCKQVFEYESDNPYQKIDPTYGGPEYEAMAALGSNCGVHDNIAVCKANELCNALGMDAISAGASVAFAMECYAHGLLTAEDTGGLEFKWGDGDLLVRSMEMIARREGFGDFLAEGVHRMSRKLGPETTLFDITVKGQELPMHEPRLKHALGIGYAVAPVGADHQMNMHDTAFSRPGDNIDRVNEAQPADNQIKPQSPYEVDENKMMMFRNELNWTHFQDCAINCHFYPYGYGHMAEALSGVTGIEYSVQDILAVGARAQTLSRLFNLREGFTAEDDKLPQRVQKAFASGPIAGKQLDEATLAWGKQRYYEMMDWTPDTGVPTPAGLEKLGLGGLLSEVSLQAQ